jgi:hypothetical protein
MFNMVHADELQAYLDQTGDELVGISKQQALIIRRALLISLSKFKGPKDKHEVHNLLEIFGGVLECHSKRERGEDPYE